MRRGTVQRAAEGDLAARRAADGMSGTPPKGQSLGAQDLDVLKHRIKSAAMQVLGDLGVEW